VKQPLIKSYASQAQVEYEKKGKVSKDFLATYPKSVTRHIIPGNFHEFIYERPAE
jgi:hypothetical protein